MEPGDIARVLRNELARLPVRNTPSARAVRREFSRRLRTADPETIIAAAEQLIRRADGIERFVAYELIAFHPTAPTLLTAARLRALAGQMDSWGAVDSFACILAGPALRDRRISAAEVRRWARSPDRWWRRAALVSTVGLSSRAGVATAPQATFAICDMLVHDRDDMVVKAMSWALRALVKHYPSEVRGYLVRRSADLAPRVRREVETKLRTGRLARSPASPYLEPGKRGDPRSRPSTRV